MSTLYGRGGGRRCGAHRGRTSPRAPRARARRRSAAAARPALSEPLSRSLSLSLSPLSLCAHLSPAPLHTTKHGHGARAGGGTCPVSTEGWTRRVHFVREGGGGGRHLLQLLARRNVPEEDAVVVQRASDLPATQPLRNRYATVTQPPRSRRTRRAPCSATVVSS